MQLTWSYVQVFFLIEFFNSIFFLIEFVVFLWPSFNEFGGLFYFDGLGIWAQGLALARHVLYHLSHPSSLFALVTFQIDFPAFLSELASAILLLLPPY
jgi:hypothetical protein